MPFLAGQEGASQGTPAGARARLGMPDAAPVFAVAFAPDGRTLATGGYDAVVRLCVCRRIDDVFRWMLARHSRIVVGGRRRWWWPTVDQRLARRLQQWGHDVVFARINAAG